MNFLKWGKKLEYSDIAKTKKQKKIINDKVELETSKKKIDYKKLEREWEQVEQTIQDLFYNMENYTGYDTLGQKPVDTKILEKYLYKRK